MLTSLRTHYRKAVIVFHAILTICLGTSWSWAGTGLLLIAHGSPNPAWNKPVLDFGCRAVATAAETGRYKAVRVCMLEAAQPDAATAVAEMEAEGCTRIVAVPLFIAASGHTHFDVPAVLGIYSSPRIAAQFAAEGIKTARPKVPLVLTGTMSEGDVLEKYALSEVRKLSSTPSDEAVLILAHGDPEHQLIVERMLRRVTTYCCGEAGISYGDWACIGMGQDYVTQALPAMETALKHKKRVLVVGLYLATSAATLHHRSMKVANPHQRSGPWPEEAVVFSDAAVIDYPELLLDWVFTTARTAADEASEEQRKQ